MKKVSIVYNQSLTGVNGINYVNNSFVEGGKLFNEYGLQLDKIYAPDGVFDCTNHSHLELIGIKLGTSAYQRERKIRKILRSLFSSKCLLGAWVKIYFNFELNAKKTIRNIERCNDESDYIIFQDIDSVLQYNKKVKKKDGLRSILLLHCSNHPLEQAIPTFPGYFRYRKLKERSIKKCNEAMHMVDKIVYLSEHAMKASSMEESKKTYIFNGIEDLTNVVTVYPSKPLQFVIVASVTFHKGQLIIIEALSLLDSNTLSKLHLTIVGGGNEFEKCKLFIKEKHLDDVVTMTGRRNDVADILKKMDVFLLPSLSEGMPMSILEAMRQGLYIMATPVGGIPEMIKPDFGEFIQRDAKAIADSIKRVVEGNVVSFISKQKSREYFVQNFTLDKMIEQYSKVLLSL